MKEQKKEPEQEAEHELEQESKKEAEHELEQEAEQEQENMLWSGNFSYYNNNIYVFNINNNLKIMIQAASVHLAHIFFTDANNAMIPVQAGFTLHDLTTNQCSFQ
jgi:hypothetical protein